MLSADKNLYEATSALKEGSSSLEPALTQLAIWVREHTEAVVLNVVYELVDSPGFGKRPCLKLIVESGADWKQIADKRSVLKRDFVKFVIHTFIGIIDHMKLRDQYETKDIYVAAEQFSDLALSLAIERVLRNEKVHLLQSLSRYNVYDVIRNGNQTVFVYYTESNQYESEFSGEVSKIREIYTDYLKAYDRFDYFSEESLNFGFDSLDNRQNDRLDSFKPNHQNVSFDSMENLNKKIRKVSFGYFLSRANHMIGQAQKKVMAL